MHVHFNGKYIFIIIPIDIVYICIPVYLVVFLSSLNSLRYHLGTYLVQLLTTLLATGRTHYQSISLLSLLCI